MRILSPPTHQRGLMVLSLLFACGLFCGLPGAATAKTDFSCGHEPGDPGGGERYLEDIPGGGGTGNGGGAGEGHWDPPSDPNISKPALFLIPVFPTRQGLVTLPLWDCQRWHDINLKAGFLRKRDEAHR